MSDYEEDRNHEQIRKKNKTFQLHSLRLDLFLFLNWIYILEEIENILVTSCFQGNISYQLFFNNY